MILCTLDLQGWIWIEGTTEISATEAESDENPGV